MQTRLHINGTCVARAIKALASHIRAGIVRRKGGQPTLTEAPCRGISNEV
jgi:hypothetical protein